MGRSRWRPSPCSPPRLQSSRNSAPANACAAKGGMMRAAASPARSRTTPASDGWPESPRARRCSMRIPEGPGAELRGARRMASAAALRGSTPGTPEARPKSAVDETWTGNAASTDAPVAILVPAGGKRRRAFSHTAGERGSPGRPSARARPRSAGQHEPGAWRAAAPQAPGRGPRGRLCPSLRSGAAACRVGGGSSTRPRPGPVAPQQSRRSKCRERAARASTAAPKPPRQGQGGVRGGLGEEAPKVTRGAGQGTEEPT